MFDRWVRQTEVRSARHAGAHRRDFLRCLPILAAAGTVPWNEWVAAQSESLRRNGKRCIVLWMGGGPSQMETFSPVADVTFAGETKAISTSVAGIQVADRLPHVAKAMDDICVIRSMTSKEGSHPRATFLMQTGYVPNPSVRHPAFGSVAAERLGSLESELPNFVHIGNQGRSGVTAGLLGTRYAPFSLRDSSRPPDNVEPRTSSSRFSRRLKLMESMDRQFARRGLSQEALAHQQLAERAAKMIRSREMEAFDIAREPTRIREAYGDGPFAEGCLLARRLVEAGVTFVQVDLRNWDTHRDNFAETAKLCASLDRPYATLLSDLRNRGMLDDTLVLWMGEFGRTPRINPRGGRDHFPQAFNVALAGCGVRGGQVVGNVSNDGMEVVERPVTVPDLFQTICQALGIDPDYENLGLAGRPLKIVNGGAPVAEVFGA